MAFQIVALVIWFAWVLVQLGSGSAFFCRARCLHHLWCWIGLPRLRYGQVLSILTENLGTVLSVWSSNRVGDCSATIALGFFFSLPRPVSIHY